MEGSKDNLLAAIIVAGGLIAAGLLNGGLYTFLRPGMETPGAIRANRMTGTIEFCAERKCVVISGPDIAPK